MPRQLKPFTVGEVTDHQSGIVTTIYLDRNTEPKVFYGMVAGERVQADSEQAVRQWIVKKCRETAAYEWRRVLVVRTSSDCGRDNGSVYLRFTEHEIAPRQATPSVWAERKVSDMPFSGRYETISDYRGPTANNPERGEFTLPYDEATKVGLTEIADRIRLLRERLNEILGSAEAPTLLAGVVRLLPAHDEGSE